MCKIHIWKEYRKTEIQRMRPYVEGEDLTGVSVSASDTPEVGGMIAVNPNNQNDQRYIAKKFFEKNYELVGIAPVEDGVVKVSQFYASNIFCICPRCDEIITEWEKDPRGLRAKCLFCGLEIAAKRKVKLSLY